VSESTDRGDEAAARSLLRDAVDRGAVAAPDFDPETVPIADADVLVAQCIAFCTENRIARKQIRRSAARQA